MRLKSLKLAGFKSFANPTTFTFRHGITAIVGPNGCGKSNVIDAIRWVLGETSAKQLRGGAMSDVIFAGTQDKAAKSVASVELTFEHTQDEQTGIRHEFNLYQELSVRRQVNLEGRSDYFINGTRCRRRDVVDVFLGTGLGARSYAVIEQGMIGRIVESSPLQLREFIEEAAGVSRYQARREETQKKLEKTQDNLARLHDMQSELVSQQKRLSKQAASAERYEEIAVTLADIKQQLAIQQLYQAKHTQQQQKIAYERSANEVATLQTSYETLKAKQDKLAAHINQEQWLKDDAQSNHYQQQLSYQQAEHQLGDAKSQLNAIEQQLTSLEQQRQQAVAEIDRLKTEQVEQQNVLEELRPQLSELTNKRDMHKRNEQPLQRAYHDAQNQLSRLQDKARVLEQQQAINNQAQKRQQQNHDKWQRRQQNWQTLWQQLQQSPSPINIADGREKDNSSNLQQTLDAQVAELNKQLQQIERQQDSVDERLSELQPQAHELQQRLNTQQHELSEDEKHHAVLAGEYDALHKILHPKPTGKSQQLANAKTADVKSDLEGKIASDYNELAITTLREQIELSTKGQQHAELLDSVLALWLDSHILISNRTNQSNMHNANGDSQKATSLWQVLEHDLADVFTYQAAQNAHSTKEKSLVENGHSLWLSAQQRESKEHLFISELPDTLIDKVLPLSELITAPDLALWQHCYLYIAQSETDNKQTLEALAIILKSLPSSSILLTSGGWLISRQGTMNLSKFANAQDSQNESNNQFLSQRLQQRSRLQALEALLDEFEVKIQDQQKVITDNQRNYDALTVSLEETRAQAEQLTRDKHKCQQQLITQRANVERVQADSQRLNADKATLEQEQQELEQEQQALNDEQQHIESDIVALTPQISDARALSQQLQSERSELNRARQTDDDAWQALQLRIQQSEMRLEHSVSSLARATEQHDKSLQSEQSLKAQHEQQQKKLPALQAALQTAQKSRDAQQAVLAGRETALTALKEEYSQQQVELDSLQNTLQVQQSELARLATELALSAARLDDASSHTQEALDAYYKVSHKYKAQSEISQQPQPQPQHQQQVMSVSNLLADFIAHDRRVRPDKIAELESESNKLEQQLSKIGAVNLAAVAELAEVNERLEPLAQQTADIAASMQTLTEAIASIDETTKTLFMQTLDAVNNELANLFAKVFGGGQASLTLNTDDVPANAPKSEQWRAGLTLMAQPKGKRNSRLAVLSGGEKTLTALSLIFAIFKQHPAPFCVLDEVDAPLDDANVARFTSLIHELAGDLQFIFISHNKLTMQIADELKGVTMPSAGISTLVSVSLDEAARYLSD